MSNLGVMINALSSSHPHFESIIKERLWGFPDNKVNRARFERIKIGTIAFLYFGHKHVKGIWAKCKVVEKLVNLKPVKYWVQKPMGYPLQVRLDFLTPSNVKSLGDFNDVKPIRREELLSAFGISIFKASADRWSLYLFGKVRERGITYSIDKFRLLLDEFDARNEIVKVKTLDHDTLVELIYKIGQMQRKYPEKEYPINGARIDVVWRKTLRSVPYIAFEVHLKGDLYADLVKLKEAYDIWNAIPFLITTSEKVNEARRWIGGTFHEIEDKFRILTVDELQRFYNAKREIKEFEVQFGIP